MEEMREDSAGLSIWSQEEWSIPSERLIKALTKSELRLGGAGWETGGARKGGKYGESGKAGVCSDLWDRKQKTDSYRGQSASMTDNKPFLFPKHFRKKRDLLLENKHCSLLRLKPGSFNHWALSPFDTRRWQELDKDAGQPSACLDILPIRVAKISLQ